MNSGNRQSRSEATRKSLMRAAEQLFAEKGIENVTVRAIVELSQQKNESALQYHFKNRQGLVDAIHKHRGAQVEARRTELLQDLLLTNPSPDLRQLCVLIIQPTFQLARADVGFRQWVKAFGRRIATANVHAFQYIQDRTSNSNGGSNADMERLLRSNLKHLDGRLFQHRMDSAIRLVGLSMSQQAREEHAFRGIGSDVFFNMLVDAVTGLLMAEVSEQTREAINTGL